MQFFPFCVAFVFCFFLKSLVTSRTIIYDLYYIQFSAGACAIHVAVRTQNYRWREHMHRDVSRSANMQRFAITDGKKNPHTEICTNAARARAGAQRNQIQYSKAVKYA